MRAKKNEEKTHLSLEQGDDLPLDTDVKSEARGLDAGLLDGSSEKSATAGDESWSV